MLNGADTPPRRHPRDQHTIRLYLRWAMPALTTWADHGHTSLRDLTPADVRAVLPASGSPRSTMGAGLRSILTLLKARKVLFTNPIARIRTGGHERRDPLPAHTQKIRESLLSQDPACAALTALAAFHGLRAGELRGMHLTDLVDGRLQLGNRSILLAEPAQARLSAWLDHRNRRWPNTANPHVFLNHRNSSRTTPVGGRWLTLTTGIPIHVLREDRILHEIHATGGDVRRICDLFGMTVSGATRYLNTHEPGNTGPTLAQP
jgi:integrase